MASDRTHSDDDEFERRYAEPLVDPPVIDPREEARDQRTGHARAIPEEPFALRGCVLTPDKALTDGYVVVSGATIADVTDTKPTGGISVIETEVSSSRVSSTSTAIPSSTSSPPGSRPASTRTATSGDGARSTPPSFGSRGRFSPRKHPSDPPSFGRLPATRKRAPSSAA